MSKQTIKFYDALIRVERTRDDLKTLGEQYNFDLIGGREIDNFEVAINRKIYEELKKLSPKLSDAYQQIVEDLARVDRHSWAGTAHEIRELLAHCLREMAPDEDVMSEPNYKPQTDNGKPSQKQRAKYIMKKRDENSTVTDMVGDIEQFEDAISSLIRRFYTRASNAAHTHADRSEVAKLLLYFEAFAHDLFDIKN